MYWEDSYLNGDRIFLRRNIVDLWGRIRDMIAQDTPQGRRDHIIASRVVILGCKAAGSIRDDWRRRGLSLICYAMKMQRRPWSGWCQHGTGLRCYACQGCARWRSFDVIIRQFITWPPTRTITDGWTTGHHSQLRQLHRRLGQGYGRLLRSSDRTRIFAVRLRGSFPLSSIDDNR